jgi:hypothetical protein
MRTFDFAWVRAADDRKNWEMQTRRERRIECQEYQEKIAWLRATEPVVSDTFFAKNDPGIRIVPTDDRIAAPIVARPFENFGTLDHRRYVHN